MAPLSPFRGLSTSPGTSWGDRDLPLPATFPGTAPGPAQPPGRFFDSIVATLRRRGATPCLHDGSAWLTAEQVADAVDARMPELGPGRRLVAIEATNAVGFVVTYLAALAGGHAVLLIGPAGSDGDGLLGRYRPDTVVTFGATPGAAANRTGEVVLRAPEPHHDLHEDLALLLSTSGSTGSPKLVRLSLGAIQANATAIASYLDLHPTDCAITTLPLSYCYGLSILHSHLDVGARVCLTDDSVLDDSFWTTVRREGVTNLSGVPYTFDLIERLGEDHLRVPSLRFVTQAGGRLAPDRVAHLDQLGSRWGWDFYVMYGQTEASARMAYLPPEFAGTFPDRVGVAVPGGSFEIQPLAGDTDVDAGVGRVVYRGANIMMGYAESPDDLRLGHELDELVTGDLGRIDEHGLLQIVGREGRFAKIFGLRIDLQQVEHHLRAAGIAAVCASDDERLVVASPTDGDEGRIRAVVGEHTPLPGRAVAVTTMPELPRLASGKVDYAAMLRVAAPGQTPTGDTIAALYARVLGRDTIDDGASFVSLSGDSLSYVTLAVRLEEALGTVPDDWQSRSVAELESARRSNAGSTRSRVARVETNVVLRALAICLIVSSHLRMAYVPVGAHLLLAISGYNFARFQLEATERPAWLSRMARPFARIALVTSAWVALSMMVWGGHSVGSLLLVNSYVGDPAHTDFRWRYWYIEALIQIGLLLAVVLASERVRRLERRHPFGFVLALLIPALVLRFGWVAIDGDTRNDIFQADTLLWLFLLGWAMQRAQSHWHRLAVSAVVLAAVPGYFFHDDRAARLLVGLLVLTWVSSIPVPRPLNRLVGWLASASLVIYLTHYWMMRPLRDHFTREGTFAIVLAAGLLIWAALGFASERFRQHPIEHPRVAS